MIKLRLVGSTADLKDLVLSTKPRGKRGSHTLAVDERLFRVLEDVVRTRRRLERGEDLSAPRRSRQDPKIPPREIQRMLRAGKSPADVAKAAEMPVPYVEQFYTPILYERDGIIRDAQNAVLEKQRLGPSGLPLGEAVAANLFARRISMTDEEIASRWNATRADSQPWAVTFTFSYRGTRRATWRYNPQSRQLTAANAVAADIGWTKAAKRAPKVAAGAGSAAGRPRRSAKRSKRATPRKRAGRKPAAKKPAGPRGGAAGKRRGASRPRARSGRNDS